MVRRSRADSGMCTRERVPSRVGVRTDAAQVVAAASVLGRVDAGRADGVSVAGVPDTYRVEDGCGV